MTNPTDTGGENPTIRDVRPPSDATGNRRRCEWYVNLTISGADLCSVPVVVHRLSRPRRWS